MKNVIFVFIHPLNQYIVCFAFMNKHIGKSKSQSVFINGFQEAQKFPFLALIPTREASFAIIICSCRYKIGRVAIQKILFRKFGQIEAIETSKKSIRLFRILLLKELLSLPKGLLNKWELLNLIW